MAKMRRIDRSCRDGVGYAGYSACGLTPACPNGERLQQLYDAIRQRAEAGDKRADFNLLRAERIPLYGLSPCRVAPHPSPLLSPLARISA